MSILEIKNSIPSVYFFIFSDLFSQYNVDTIFPRLINSSCPVAVSTTVASHRSLSVPPIASSHRCLSHRSFVVPDDTTDALRSFCPMLAFSQLFYVSFKFIFRFFRNHTNNLSSRHGFKSYY